MCIRDSLLSLAGIYQPKKKIEESKLPAALTRFLEDQPHVKTLYPVSYTHLDVYKRQQLLSALLFGGVG